MRQIIIVRKDLGMSPGKMAVQVAHASWAFVSWQIKKNARFAHDGWMRSSVLLREDVYRDWFCDIVTKTVCEAKNKYQLEKVVSIAEGLGLKEDEDFYRIYDRCLTELEPEETDADGNPVTLTCIGFCPLPEDIAKQISKKYQLYA